MNQTILSSLGGAAGHLPGRTAGRTWWTASLFVQAVFTAAHPTVAAEVVRQAWVQRFNGPLNGSRDIALKIICDQNGNAIVAGFTDDGITGSDILTIKYSGVDGSVIWQARYNGPADDTDRPQAVAVDSGGNVVVTGYSYGSKYDFYTAKYAAANGALLWEQRYNGPADDYDSARAVAVDGTGNVVVTGDSWNGSDNNDLYTAKYAAADGAILWTQLYKGASGTALAVDVDGNVVVAGSSWNGSHYAYYTAKVCGGQRNPALGKALQHFRQPK